MEILYLIIPITLILVTVIIIFLWWSSRSGQYDDMEGPAWKILMDDDTPKSDEPAEKADDAAPKT
ncbi:MAG: cbb3-type cytochrome oxidase assembly protein CcoS [Gammaproteobacteria bacterium]|nr:MAG: cbb3-type cytochrome oxidase assembly protein CcoS [Gammaproteobacteria bacterium]